MSEVEIRKAEDWGALVEAQQSSGQTIVGFCRERGIGVHRFHYHKRRIRQQVEDVGFRQVRIRGGSGVRLVLESGEWQVEVDSGFDGRCLRQVLEVLG